MLPTKGASEVMATKFVLTDDKGNMVGVFERDSDGPRLAMFDSDGRVRIEAYIDGVDRAWLKMNDESEQTTFQVAVTRDKTQVRSEYIHATDKLSVLWNDLTPVIPVVPE